MNIKKKNRAKQNLKGYGSGAEQIGGPIQPIQPIQLIQPGQPMQPRPGAQRAQGQAGQPEPEAKKRIFPNLINDILLIKSQKKLI
jgi:hypothetical protein